ncbi:sigma 54-interacting transcriptional regulator [Haloimpatiens sp. FM7315]|uniref:sigma 54-interacting transcriptional regulator n=1 Tax=Haloimpatiens sp. FM7315 TaxID=3298609 RepID=UPI00370BE464
MKKKDSIYLYIEETMSLDYIKEKISKKSEFGLEAKEIEEKFDIVRNNASTLLNELWREKKLVKVITRPVRFIPREVLKKLIEEEYIKDEYTVDELKLFLENHREKDGKKDPFENLLGYKSSLINQINQAKAAIMYPPNGLHTLILGESGVGKTTFANTMYSFAKINKTKVKGDFPLISFNCSDYFNNPQLLLSQLFGHIKGAFTGADTDKIGLVEKANGGILFLDEVHRLPPDGQEMLFFLIDKGEYHRLGETDKTRKSSILIIAATTEEPDDVLLTTFLRRIPVVIKLPSFRERDIEEKIEIIENIFYNEAVTLKMPIRISPEVVKALGIYEFKGNIGQISSEIKLLCAKAFLEHMQEEQNQPRDSLLIEFQMLKKEIKEYVFNANKNEENIKEIVNFIDEDLVIYPHKVNKDNRESVYDILLEKVEDLKKQGLDEKDIYSQINNSIENYFHKLVDNYRLDKLDVRQLYKIIDKKIVDISIEFTNLACEKMNCRPTKKLMFSLAFHIQSLLKRIKENKPITNPNIFKIELAYPKECEIALDFIEKLNQKLSIKVPRDEKGFLAILLANNKNEEETQDKVGVLVVCHGESTATSMAKVANSLLNSNIVKAIDMTLDSEINKIYIKVSAAIRAIDKGKGVLLLVDMGSLTGFGSRIMKDTGIKVKTIENVSTLTVLESLRNVMYKNESIDEIYDALVEKKQDNKIIVKEKKKAIITVCVTGQGASMMAKSILIKILEDLYDDIPVEIIPLDYTSLDKDSLVLDKIRRKFDVIACVGSLKPKIQVPYFPINQLLNDKFKDKFKKFLSIKLLSEVNNEEIEKEKDVFETAREMLEQYVKYLNPKFAVHFIRKFIEELNLNCNKGENGLLDLIIHLGCMLDRCMQSNVAIFDNKEEFIEDNKDKFNNIRKAIKVLEEAYKISIGEDEVCYLIKVINNCKF